MKRALSLPLILVLGAGVAGCGSGGVSNARRVSVTGSDGATISLEMPKDLTGPTSSSSQGLRLLEYKDTRRRRVAIFGAGPAGTQTLASVMSSLLGRQPTPTSRQISAPKISGASQTQLVVLGLPGSDGPARTWNLVATTTSGAIVELFMGDLASDRGFDATAIINSIRLSHS